MQISKKLFSLFFVILCFSVSVFAIETKVFEEKTDKYTVKIQYVEEMEQAKFILTIPQALFERSKAFNLMNAKIRKIASNHGFIYGGAVTNPGGDKIHPPTRSAYAKLLKQAEMKLEASLAPVRMQPRPIQINVK